MCSPSFVWICPQLFEILCSISFLAWSLNGEESLLKILVVRSTSRSRSSPKSNQFILVTHPNCPQNFIRIHPTFWDILHTNKQTDKQTESGENIVSFTFSGGGKKRNVTLEVVTLGRHPSLNPLILMRKIARVYFVSINRRAFQERLPDANRGITVQYKGNPMSCLPQQARRHSTWTPH